MNTYHLSFFLRHPDGTIHGHTQIVAATSATMAILQLEALPLPGRRVGGVSWTIIGPPIVRPNERHFRPLAA